jgi:hypothetical protein
MSDTYEINAKITADDSGFQATFDNLESGLNDWGINLDKMYEKGSSFFKGFGIDIDQMASKFGTTGPMLAGSVGIMVAAFEGLKKVISETTADFAEDETAQLKFNAAIAANASMAEGANARLNDLATSFGLLTGNTTSSVQSQIAMLSATGRTEDQIKKMMTAAQGLAAATGTDLNTALAQLNQTFSGSSGRMAKMTPELADLTKEQLEHGEAIDIVNKKYGQFADTLSGSTAVSIANQKNQIGELRSILGEFFESGIKPIRDIITKIIEYLVQHKEIVIGVIEGIAAALSLIIGLFNPILGAIALVVTALFSLQNATGGWKLLWLETEKVALEVLKAILDFSSYMANATIALINGVIATYNNLAKALGGKQIRFLDPVDISTATGINAALKNVETQIDATRDAQNKLAAASKNQADNSKAAAVALAAQTKAEEDAAKAVYDSWSQEKEVAEWEAAYLKKKKDDADKKASYESEWADKAAKSSLDLLSKQKGYDALSLQYTIDSIEKQEDAEVAKAKAMGASEATIANIHKTYQDQIVQVSNEAKDKQIAAGTTVANAWANTYAQMVEKAKSWNDVVSSIASSIGSVFSDGLEAMGEALYRGEDAWTSLANVALSALADILKSIGEQLAALAVVHAVSLDWGGAAIAVAGSVAALIASGVISAMAQSYAATGTDYSVAGTYMVGEQGPELVTIPQGSTVTNATGTSAAFGGSASKNLSITINSPKQLSIFEARRQAVLAARQLAYGV